MAVSAASLKAPFRGIDAQISFASFLDPSTGLPVAQGGAANSFGVGNDTIPQFMTVENFSVQPMTYQIIGNPLNQATDVPFTYSDGAECSLKGMRKSNQLLKTMKTLAAYQSTSAGPASTAMPFFS